MLRSAELDLDLDRECSRDAASELFLDSANEELLDLEGDFGDPTERGDCGSPSTTFPSGSGDGDLDFETLFLSIDFELDLDDL